MAFTKLYLTTATAPYTPATIRGAWDTTAGSVTRTLSPVKDYGGAVTNVQVNESVATANYDVLLYRGVSGPLAAQTISGNLDVVIGVWENPSNADMAWHIHVYVTQGDSDTPRGTLLTDYRETITNEWTTTPTGRTLAAAQALASLAITAGDRLVVEIGYVALNTSTDLRSGILYYGSEVGGAPVADLAAAGTDVTLKAGFVSFSVSVTEQDLATRVTSAPTLVTAGGTGDARISAAPVLVTAGGTGEARVSAAPVLVTTVPLPPPSIAIPVGALAVTGYAPTVSETPNGITIAVPAGSLIVTGYALSGDGAIAIPAGSLVVSGAEPALRFDVVLEMPAGALVITGYAVDLVGAGEIAIPVGAIQITGYEPVVSAPVTTGVPAGALIITGYAPVASVALTIDVPVGALVVTGYAPVVAAPVTIEVPAGALVVTGHAPVAYATQPIDVPVGALVVTGYAPTVVVSTLLLESQAVLEVLEGQIPIGLRASQVVIEVLVPGPEPPGGGGEVPGGIEPPASTLPTGVVRIFGRLTYGGGSPETEIKVSETPLSDPASWYGGYGFPVLLSVSSMTRELSDGVRTVEVRIELADTDRRFRTLATTHTLGGATFEVFLVSDTVRYARGEPHRRFCGRVHEHRALPGFRYELLVRDVLSEEMALLADTPRIPQKLSPLDLPGMSAEYDGLALQIAIGQLNDETEVGTTTGIAPQGVVPPLIVAPLINFQTAFGGIDQDVIVAVISHGALAPTGIWRVFYNTPTDPYTRIEVSSSVWGTLLWAPNHPGWSDTGLPNDYADYPADPAYTNRYTPLYIAANHANSQPYLDGRILAAINLYGVTENADGTGLYLSDAPRIFQWLLANFLYTQWKTGDYNAMPTFANGITIINSASVQTSTARLRAFMGGGADAHPVGFLIGRGGQQQTLRQILGELCQGVAMEQGIDRHGRLMLDVEDVDAVATLTLSDLLDIETGEFEVWVDRSAYRNCLEYRHGFRYVPAVAPLPTPPAGETLPVRPVGPNADWTSGLQKLENGDAIAANGGRRTPPMQLDNMVVRSAAVAASWAGRVLARAVGPSPSYDGPRMFRLTTSWQALGVELGDVIAIDHLEGLGATGYVGQRCRVLKITEDLQQARIILEGRVLFSGSPS